MMGEEEGTFGGGKGRVVQARRGRSDAFGRAKQKVFLDALTETANVRQSADRAGVSYASAYRWRRTKPEFRARWERVLEDGYAALEAGLLERAREAVGEIAPGGRAGELVAPMDAKLAFALLQNHERKLAALKEGKGFTPVDDLKIIERLEKGLKRYDREAEAKARKQGQGE
ncbi:hypothetical protein [Sphingomonas arenae]|uniref:hypothetical protein n=1 Tax=Sphingomonas arenae TaxID=2812555 RepID=UPI001F3FF32B|nr:hypothetical protein [Sphingomonas arenae]